MLSTTLYSWFHSSTPSTLPSMQFPCLTPPFLFTSSTNSVSIISCFATSHASATVDKLYCLMLLQPLLLLFADAPIPPPFLPSISPVDFIRPWLYLFSTMRLRFLHFLLLLFHLNIYRSTFPPSFSFFCLLFLPFFLLLLLLLCSPSRFFLHAPLPMCEV